jgi:cysteine-rich repeat protein
MQMQEKKLKAQLLVMQKEEDAARAESEAMQKDRLEANDNAAKAAQNLANIKEEAKAAAKAEEVADKLANSALSEVVRASSERKAAFALQKTFQVAIDKKKIAEKALEERDRRDRISTAAHKARSMELDALAALQRVQQRKHEVDLAVLQNKEMHQVCDEREHKTEQSELALRDLKSNERLKAAEVTQKQDVLERAMIAAEKEKAKGLSQDQCIRGKTKETIGKPWSMYARSPLGGGNCVCAQKSCQVSAPGLADLVCVDFTGAGSVYSRSETDQMCECKGTMCLHGGTCHHTHVSGSMFEKAEGRDCKCRNGCMMKQEGPKSLKGLCTDLRENKNGFVKLAADRTHCAALGKARLGNGQGQQAFVYKMGLDGKWSLLKRIEPTSPQSTEYFGSSAVFAQPLDSMLGTGLHIIVGALNADSNGVYESGAIYVFENTVCGDSRRSESENCEDGNTQNGDGCSSTCRTEPGFQCSGGTADKPDSCGPQSGDGRVVGFEECDDGNLADGDGCSSKLVVEPSWSCTGGSAVTMSTCERCGNGKVRGIEECDSGKPSKYNKGCTECTVDKGYICFGGSLTTRSTCMMRTEYVKQMVNRKIELQESICKEQNSGFMLSDLTTGDGDCVTYPEEGDSLLTSLHLAGSELSGSDLAISQVGPMLLPAIPLPSVMAADGTAGALVSPVCRSTRRLICTSDENGGGGSFSKSCISVNKIHCHEVFLDAKFCDSNDEFKGKLAWRFGETVCLFKNCITPGSWTTPEGQHLLPSAWCLSASEGSVLPLLKSAYTPPPEGADAGTTSRRLLQQQTSKKQQTSKQEAESWLRVSQGLDRKASEARIKRSMKWQLRKEVQGELDAPSTTVWRANEIETKQQQKTARENLDASGGQPAYVHELRLANEATNKHIRALRTAAVDKARDMIKKLPLQQAEQQSNIMNTAEQQVDQLVQKIEASQLSLKATAHKEAQFKKEAAAELKVKRRHNVGLIMHRMESSHAAKENSLSEKQKIAEADAASAVLAKSVSTEQEALSAKSPWIRRVAEAKYGIAMQRHENDQALSRVEEGVSKQAADSARNSEDIASEKDKSQRLKQLVNKLNVDVQASDAHITKLKSGKTDCVLSMWLQWGDCEKKCDIGVQRRTRLVEAAPTNGGAECGSLESTQSCFVKHCEKCGDSKVVGIEACDDGNTIPGDGCDEYCGVEAGWSCFGGSTASVSHCEQCGNGKIVGTEECDDANQADDDGCSKDCLIQPGYVCVGVPSKCVTLSEYDKSLEMKTFEEKRSCHSQPGELEFVVTDASTGTGECQPRPEDEFEGTTMHVQQLAVINGSSISGAPAAINKAITTLSDPVGVDSAVDANGARGAQPYAVCRSTSQKMCSTNRLPDEKGLERVCTFNAEVTCVEVAVHVRFCNVEGNDAKGQVEQRQHDGRTNGDGDVCVFKNCNVPTTWTTPEGTPINPNAWCFPIAAQTGINSIESDSD